MDEEEGGLRLVRSEVAVAQRVRVQQQQWQGEAAIWRWEGSNRQIINIINIINFILIHQEEQD